MAKWFFIFISRYGKSCLNRRNNSIFISIFATLRIHGTKYFKLIILVYQSPGVYPVTPAMGKPSFDGPECINEVKLVAFFFIIMYFLSGLA